MWLESQTAWTIIWNDVHISNLLLAGTQESTPKDETASSDSSSNSAEEAVSSLTPVARVAMETTGDCSQMMLCVLY